MTMLDFKIIVQNHILLIEIPFMKNIILCLPIIILKDMLSWYRKRVNSNSMKFMKNLPQVLIWCDYICRIKWRYLNCHGIEDHLLFHKNLWWIYLCRCHKENLCSIQIVPFFSELINKWILLKIWFAQWATYFF